MLGLVFTHPQRGGTIIDLFTAAITTDLFIEAIDVELKGKCNLCSIS
jgi:hypothetical protein